MEGEKRGESSLRQAFMSGEEYEEARADHRAWSRLQRPLCSAAVVVLWTAVVMATMIMADVVFAVSGDALPFCQPRRLPSYNLVGEGAAGHAYTEEQAVDAFRLVVLLPSSVVFLFSAIYLFAGISVAHTAPDRHSCLKVVENDCCASRRGGVRCLSTLNLSFMTAFVLLSVVLGCFTWRLGTPCSTALFWSYEIACWGLIVLLGGTAFVLQRKVALIIDAGEYYGLHETGVELLEAFAIMPDVEGRVSSGFKAWMGPRDALILSDDDDEESGAHPVHGGLDDIWEGDATG